MNYYNPYFYTIPSYIGSAPKVGLFSRLFGGSGITLSSILGGTQKALNFANQAIPIVQQVKPMIGNAKTMFKVMNEFKKTDSPSTISKKVPATTTSNNKIMDTNDNKEEISSDYTGPQFFI